MKDMKRWTRVFSGILAASMIMGTSAQMIFAEEVEEVESSEYVEESVETPADQLDFDQEEADRLAAEQQAEAERLAAEQAEAERIAAEQAEAERLAAEQAEAERIAAEQAEAERLAAEQAEAERIAAEQAEAERIAAEQAEAERIAAEQQAEAERIAAEQAEAERLAAEQAEAERLAAEQAEAERQEAEKAEAERIAKELAEADRFLADLESEADWVRTLPEELRHEMTEEPKEDDYRADIVAIANSQRGYRESEINYIELEDGTKSPYTRYGQWFNDPYANPWDAEFACFVLYYAGLQDVPFDGDTAAWTFKLAERDMYFGSDYENAKAGDLIFLTEDDGFFHVGVITGFDEEDRIVFVEGTIGEGLREVTESRIYRDDHRISAFGVVVAADPEEIIDINEDEVPLAAGPEFAAEDGEAQDDAAAGESLVVTTADFEEIPDQEVPLAAPALVFQTATAGVFTDETKEAALENTSITVMGCLPEGAEVTAWPVQVEVDGEETFAAFQIQILDAQGNEFHSKAGDGYEYAVTIQNQNLTEMLENSSNAHGWHQGSDEEKTDLSYNLPGDGSVQFTADEI